MIDDGFEALLKWLADDRDAAERRLENIRARLVYFFRRRGFAGDADDAAQEVLVILAAKCGGPEPPPYEAPDQLMVGIARNIARRRFERAGREQPLDAVKAPVIRFPRPVAADAVELRCFEASLKRLTDDDRATLKQYFSSDEWGRQELAADLRINATALRVRAHRLKKRLREMIDECLDQKTAR